MKMMKVFDMTSFMTMRDKLPFKLMSREMRNSPLIKMMTTTTTMTTTKTTTTMLMQMMETTKCRQIVRHVETFGSIKTLTTMNADRKEV